MKANEKLFLLDSPGRRIRFTHPVTQLRNLSQIREALEHAPKTPSVWIAMTSEATDKLLREIIAAGWQRAGAARPLGRLLLLFPARPASLPALEEFFRPIAWGTSAFRHLPHDELAAALTAPARRNILIAGFVDSPTNTLVLYRGDFDRLAVPLSLFRAFGNGPTPDPSKLSFEDYGQTVRLGTYEAAADAILYEADRQYRREMNSKRREAEKSFGACLRRLRVLRGLRQGDFSSIPAKTIARIERGEVAKPHRDTLEKIAYQLGVTAEEIETY